VPPEQFERLHAAAIAEDAWVLDGGYTSEPWFVDRIRRADLVVITEAPLIRCLYRVIRRTIRLSGHQANDPFPPSTADRWAAYY
jgi:hypothetical protein